MSTFDKLSTSVLEQLTEEMKIAMKAGDRQRLDAVRLLISAIKYAQVDNPEMDEAGMLKVLTKEAKKRRESIEAYTAAGRDEQAAGEKYELELIETYLPKQMSEDEVRVKVRELLTTVEQGENLPAGRLAFGQVMQKVMKELAGKVEGGVVAKIVKEEYQTA